MPNVPILYRDEDLLVVDKPAGLLVVPAPGRAGPVLVDVVAAQIGQRVLAVHRLDEQTSGVLLLALTEAARIGLEQLFRDHRLERRYLALVAGTPVPAAGRIESQLREEGGIVRVVTRGGERAVTHYETLQRRGRHTLVGCRLETGRRNQIRVHLAALGCPVAGDRKYGYRERDGQRFRRVMLHSWRIVFRHPRTGDELVVEANAPEPELRPDQTATP